MTLPELTAKLNGAGIRLSHVAPCWSDEPGVFLVYLTSGSRSPERQAQVMGEIPELAEVERRHNRFIYRVRT